MRTPNPTLAILLPTLLLWGALGSTGARAEKPKEPACDSNIERSPLQLTAEEKASAEAALVAKDAEKFVSALFKETTSVTDLDATPRLSEFIQISSNRNTYLRYRADLTLFHSPRISAMKAKLLIKVKELLETNATEEEIISETKELIAGDRKVAWIFSNSGRTSLSKDSQDFFETYSAWKSTHDPSNASGTP